MTRTRDRRTPKDLPWICVRLVTRSFGQDNDEDGTADHPEEGGAGGKKESVFRFAFLRQLPPLPLRRVAY